MELLRKSQVGTSRVNPVGPTGGIISGSPVGLPGGALEECLHIAGDISVQLRGGVAGKTLVGNPGKTPGEISGGAPENPKRYSRRNHSCIHACMHPGNIVGGTSTAIPGGFLKGCLLFAGNISGESPGEN